MCFRRLFITKDGEVDLQYDGGVGVLEHSKRYTNNLMQLINTISWNAMIARYVQNRYIERDHELFKKMHDAATISWIAMIVKYYEDIVS